MTSPASVFESWLVSVTDVTVFRIDSPGAESMGDRNDTEVDGGRVQFAVAVFITGALASTLPWRCVWLTTRSWNAPGASLVSTLSGSPVSGSLSLHDVLPISPVFETCRL